MFGIIINTLAITLWGMGKVVKWGVGNDIDRETIENYWGVEAIFLGALLNFGYMLNKESGYYHLENTIFENFAIAVTFCMLIVFAYLASISSLKLIEKRLKKQKHLSSDLFKKNKRISVAIASFVHIITYLISSTIGIGENNVL